MSAPTLWFLILTFTISAVAGLGAFAIGGAKTFESPTAMPLLLLTIWSPNVAAVMVTVGAGDSVRDLLAPLLDGAPPAVWAMALSPLAVRVVDPKSAVPGVEHMLNIGVNLLRDRVNLLME